MIYKIQGSQVCDALVNGAKFIIFSTAGEFALVQSDTRVSPNLGEYTENELSALYADPLYRQPCKDC